MNKILFSLFFVFYSAASFSQNLHLIMVADIVDNKFGMVSISDQERIERMFKYVSSELNFKFLPNRLNKDSFNSTEVRKSIKNLETQPADIIVFYYSGMGFYSQKTNSTFPILDLYDSAKSPLSFDEIGNLLKQKNNRFSLALADCRDTIPPPGVKVAPLAVLEDIRKLIVEKIFLEPCGVMKVASTSKGLRSYLDISGGSSLFATSMDHTFSEILTNAIITEVDDISLDQLFRKTQEIIRGEVGERKQKIKIEKIPCEVSKKRLSKRFPIYKNAPTSSKISELMYFLPLANIDDRQKTIKYLDSAFSEDIKIVLRKRIDATKLEMSSEVISKNDFLESLKAIDPNTTDYDFLFFKSKRTADYLKFKEVEIVKTVKKI